MRTVALLLALGLVVFAAGCASPRLVAPGDAVAAALPTEAASAWYRCSAAERSSASVDAAARHACALVAADREAREGYEERRPKNKIVLFVGYTWERGGGTDREHGHGEESGHGGGTYGLDYVREITEHFALVAFGEWVAGDLDTIVLGVGIEWKPVEQVAFVIAPGLEKAEGGAWTGLVRLGVGYIHPIGRGFTISPSAYVDLRPHEVPAWLVGVGLGKSF